MKKQSKLKTLLRLVNVVKPLTGFMLLAVMLGTLGFLSAQFIPIIGGYALLAGLGPKGGFRVEVIIGLLLLLAVIRAVLRFGEQWLNHYIAFTLLALIRDRVFRALRRLCPAKLESREKGDLISLITTDVELLEVFYTHTLSPICIAVLTSAVMCVFIGSYHWSLGLLAALAFLTVGLALPTVISRRSGTLGDELRAQSGELAAHMLENIRGLDETIQYGGGGQRLESMNRKTDELSRRQEQLSKLTGTNFGLANTLILFSDVAMLLLAGELFSRGVTGFDGFLLPLLALMSSFGPVMALANLGTTLQSTIASGARVLAILDETPETEDITGQPPVSFAGAECSGVSFAYGEEEVLSGLTVSFPENRIIGVVGQSGCGKSTMLKLFMRFWQVKTGNISISGRSVDAIDTANLRMMESYMTQETQLFCDTIAGNIRLARPEATDAEVENACRKAALHDFILTLPDGYQTQVGELGETLSGGERQRIGLARAFLHNAPFLLLDEPTSNLDSLNEAVILRSLKEEAKGKTIALVSHRRSTVRIADEVVMIESGRRKEA